MSPESILIVKPSSMGDVIHTLPALARLRRAFPDARIAWLVNSEWAPLLTGHPALTEVVIFPRAKFRRLPTWPSAVREVFQMRTAAGAFEVALDFQGLLRSALLAKWCRSRRVVGLANAREGAPLFYHHKVELPAAPLHAIDRYLLLADHLIQEPENSRSFHLPEGTPPPFPGPPPEGFLVLHPFSKGQGKSLSREVLQTILEQWQGDPIVLAGRCSETIPPVPGTIDLLNRTDLHQLIWLIRHARAVVSVDSGPMHLAAALSRPLLGIHTWTDPRRVGPCNPQNRVWKNGRIKHVRDLTNEDAAPGPLPNRSDVPGILAAMKELSAAPE